MLIFCRICILAVTVSHLYQTFSWGWSWAAVNRKSGGINFFYITQSAQSMIKKTIVYCFFLLLLETNDDDLCSFSWSNQLKALFFLPIPSVVPNLTISLLVSSLYNFSPISTAYGTVMLLLSCSCRRRSPAILTGVCVHLYPLGLWTTRDPGSFHHSYICRRPVYFSLTRFPFIIYTYIPI